jgi:beta-ribofuranosylaminobenzene 5'-phosphate synthase
VHDSVSQASRVTVTAPARLHLGFFDLNGGTGRRFGSMGLAVSELKTSLTVRKAKVTNVSGPESDRVRGFLDATATLLAVHGAHDVEISEVVPTHSGLGSGTQLALAVATAVRRLHGRPPDIESDAIKLGRGGRSGVGIGLFHHGGLVVDGGRGSRPRPAPIISRLAFPNHWRVLVILDPTRRGLHGAEEIGAFATLPHMSEADAARMCQLVLMKALPALAEQDLANFGAAIKELQSVVGDYFAQSQGGSRFSSPVVAPVLDALDRAGAHGIGQSSWGPTGFAFASSPDEASRLATIARQQAGSGSLDIRICRGLNHGAEIVAQAQRIGE